MSNAMFVSQCPKCGQWRPKRISQCPCEGWTPEETQAVQAFREIDYEVPVGGNTGAICTTCWRPIYMDRKHIDQSISRINCGMGTFCLACGQYFP